MASLCKRTGQARRNIKQMRNTVDALQRSLKDDPGAEGFDAETVRDAKQHLRALDKLFSQSRPFVC